MFFSLICQFICLIKIFKKIFKNAISVKFLIWVQNVCKSYLQATEVATGEECMNVFQYTVPMIMSKARTCV